MSSVRSPSTASVAVAPGSVNTLPTSSSILAAPNKVITGATVSSSTSITVTTMICVDVLVPSVAVTVAV